MKKFILGSLVLFAFSCSTQTVSVDYDRNQDFSQIRDYKIEFQANTMSELDINRIHSALRAELATKSMTFNENSEVTISVIPEEFITKEQNSHVGIGMGGGNRSFGSSINFGIPITNQKLNQHYLVSIRNAEKLLVWEGSLEVKMPANAQVETMEANIQKGIQKLFRKYPPQQ